MARPGRLEEVPYSIQGHASQRRRRMGEPCGKKRYGSRAATRRAHRHNGHRIRAYWCEACVAFHATGQEKRA